MWKYYLQELSDKTGLEVREGIQRTDVGTVFIKNLDKENRKGEFGIFIGEDKFRGKGIGKLSTEKMLEFAFEELKLNKVWLTVFANNIKAIDCYEKAGFVKCAFYSQEILRKNKLLDVVGMEILKNRWSKMWKGNPKMYGKGK